MAARDGGNGGTGYTGGGGSNAAGGGGGSSGGTQVNGFDGQTAGAGVPGTGGIAPSGGGNGGNGGWGNGTPDPGDPGFSPGGGGGGAGRSTSNGGNGANGQIIISYDQPVVYSVTKDIITPNGSYGVGQFVSVIVNFNYDVNVTGSPELTLETGGTDRIATFMGWDREKVYFRYTVQVGDVSADLDVKDINSLTLNGGSITSLENNDAILTLPAPGSAQSLSTNANIIIDGILPGAPTTPDLDPTDDLGSSTTDNITSSDANLTFTGTAEAGSTITYRDATLGVLGTTTTNAGGTYSFDLDLSDGSYSLYCNATDIAGNTGSPSGTLNFTVDKGNPSVTVEQAPAPQTDPTSMLPVNFILTFSEPIDQATLVAGDILKSGSAPGINVTNLTTSDGGTTWIATVTATGAGDITIDLGAGACIDVAGNTNNNSTSTDNTITYTQSCTPPTLTTSTTDKTSCVNPNGSAQVTAITAGGEPSSYTMTWYNGASVIPGNEVITNNNVTNGAVGLTAFLLLPGDYTAEVINNDVAGCSSTVTVTINEATVLPSILPSSTDNTSCISPNGSATVTASTVGGEPVGGYSYEWLNSSLGQVGLTATVVNLPTDTYFITVTNNDTGCQAGASVTINNNWVQPTLSVTTNPNTSCGPANGSATVAITNSVGGETYVYQWYDGSSNLLATSTNTATGLLAGDYAVTVTILATGCASGTGLVVPDNIVIPAITLGTSPSVTQGTTTANLPYTGTTGAPTDYSIDFNSAAEGAGFTDVVYTSLPASPITLTVPAGAAASTYNATIKVRNGTTLCESVPAAFTVTITSQTLTIANLSTGLATSPLIAGSSGKAILGFSLTSTGTQTVTALNPQLSSDPIGKLFNWILVRSTDNSFTTTGDNVTVTATINVSSAPANISITGLSESITSTSKNYFLVADVNSAVTAGTPAVQALLNSVNVTVSSGTITGSSTGPNYSFNSSTTTVASAGIGLATSPLLAGSTGQAVFGFSLLTNGTQTVSSINVQLSSDPTGKLSNWQLIRSTDNDFSTAVDNSTLGSLTFTPSATQVAITGLSEPMAVTAKFYFLVADVNGTVNGATPAIQLSLGSTNITVNTGSTAGSATSTNYAFTSSDVTPPTVSSISYQTPSSSPTNANSLTFRIVFSEAVTGVQAADFTQTLSGVTIGSIAVTPIDALTYDVTFGTVSGNGTVRCDVLNTATIIDAASNAYASNFTTGPSYTVDQTAPGISSFTKSAGQADPTNISPVSFTVVFTEAINPGTFVSGDILIGGSAGGQSVSTPSTTDNITWSFTITATSSGTINPSIGAGAFSDVAGNTNSSTSATTVSFDNIAPTAAVASAASNPTNAAIPVTITFSEPTTNFVVGDISVTNGTAGSFSGSGTTYTATITPTAAGTVNINVAAGAATDAAGNGNTVSNTFSTVFDNVAPTVTITSGAPDPTNAPFLVTITFSETTTNFIIGDISVTNGTAGTFSGTGTTYTATITPTAAGTVSVSVAAGAATDAAANGNTVSNTLTRVFDNVAPTITITSAATDPTNAPIPVTITFSEVTTNFVVGDITVTNGTAGAFSGSGTTYSATITPINAGTVTVSIGAGAATDAAGNANTVSNTLTRVFDNVAPTVNITSTSTNPTNAPIPVTITFSEVTTNFVVGDITVTNGTAGSFSGSGTTYTATITPVNAGTVTVSVAAGAATDATNNGNTISNTLTRTFDNVAPSVTITSITSDPTKTSPIPITITFSESVTGFVVGDITVTNGTAGSFAGSGTTYSASITPINAGVVTVSVAASVAADGATNGNTVSNTLSRTFDNVAPTVVISSTTPDPISGSPFPVTITFSESVAGFVVGDITVSNGTAGGFTGSGTTYTVNITPAGSGTVTVSVAANVAADVATNGNTASNVLSRTVDATPPTVIITSTTSDPTNALPIPVTITFSESVSGFVISDITVTNGTAGSFAGSGTTYTASITPINSGAVTVSVAANVATDAANNGNTASAALSRLFDGTAPTVTSISLQTPTNALTNASSLTFRVVFSEPVLNVDAADFTKTLTTVAGGAISIVVVNTTTYDISFPVSGSGTVRLDILSAATITDAAGNDYTSNFTTGQVYTLDQTPPVFSNTGPTANTIVNGTEVSFTLSETLSSGTITWTRTGGTADPNTHIQDLAGPEMTSGTHSNILLVNSPMLVAGAVYSIAFSGTDLAGNTSSPVTIANITYTPAASRLSDIIVTQGFSYPQNIDYASLQEGTDIQTTATSVAVAGFTIRDSGTTGIDPDPYPTTLTELTLDLGANFSIIRRIALYDNTGVEVSGTDKAVSARTVTFSLISLPCQDNSTVGFTIRVSFQTAVTDNEQFSLMVSSVKAKDGESEFAAAANLPGTSTSGDNNRIEVSATSLRFVQQPANTFINEIMVPAVTLDAVDVNNNLDLDFSGSVNLTSTGTLSNQVSATLSSGLGVGSEIIHTVGGTNLTLTTANSAGLTEAISSVFDIYETTQQVSLVIRPFITPNTVDAQNNVLFIENIDFFPENSVKLIDRWGIPVKTWVNFSNYSNPEIPGQDDFDFTSLSVGNYVCIVEFKDATTGKKRDQAQMITVLK
jgi:hypothetical protein